MIDHITLKTSDIEKGARFYEAALGTLGYAMQRRPDWEKMVAFCGNNKRDIWLRETKSVGTETRFTCLAFDAASIQNVDDFYVAALGAGGSDNGAPGYRPKYHPGYYAAFVLDPDGNNIEAVFDDWNQAELVRVEQKEIHP